MEQRDAAAAQHQKRDPMIFRSSSIDTSTPRLPPDHRRPQSFSSPTFSPAASPSFSDHSTNRGFYSPRSGEEENEDEVDDGGGGDDDVDERGYFYRPRSPAVEMPVISTVSRSVRVEPKAVTRVDNGAKEMEYLERRVVEEEDGEGLDFGGRGGGRGSVRRKWEGRNTVVFESGLGEKERRVAEEEESSVEFRGRRVFDFGAKEKEIVVPERRVVEEENVGLGDRIGRKSRAFVSDSGVKEKEVVVPPRRVVEEESVEFRDQKDRKSNAFVSNSGVKEKDVLAPQRRVAEEESVELGDRRGRKSNAFVADSGVKEVVKGGRVGEEGSVQLRDGRGVGVQLEARNAMVLDSSPKVLYDSRPKEEVAGMKRVVYESGSKEEDEFGNARVLEEGGGGGGKGVEGVKPSLRLGQEGRRSEMFVMRKAAICLRVLGLVMCLISFSIMAMNKNKGWALDSFDRYKEFRYCMVVSILGFVYSATQAVIVAYHLGTGNYSNQHSQLRYYLDFFMDQALSYLLISASSSAATRVDDWVSNWGKDKFPHMASASVIVSFLAFGAFAFSSLVSGYTLCSANVS